MQQFACQNLDRCFAPGSDSTEERICSFSSRVTSCRIKMADMSGAALNVSMFLVIFVALLSFLMIIWFMFSMYTLSEFSPTKKAQFFPQTSDTAFEQDILTFRLQIQTKKAPYQTVLWDFLYFVSSCSEPTRAIFKTWAITSGMLNRSVSMSLCLQFHCNDGISM